MNTKLLLVHAITLLYRESQLPGVQENSSQLVRDIISSIRIPEISIGLDHERDVIDGLKKTALTMCDATPDQRYEPSELLQRLKVNTIDEGDLYAALYDGIANDLPRDALQRLCLNMKRSLSNHFRDEKIQEIMSKATFDIKFNMHKITNMKKWVANVVSQLEPFQVDNTTKDPAILADVDMNKIDDVANVFGTIKQQANGASLLKTGSQGLNRMFGGGFRRGEEVVLGALQHQYKTGLSLTLFKQIALYNVPQMIDKTKKPLLLRISFEDDISLNFQFLYKSLKENETGQKADITGLSNEEMAEYVQRKLAINGYNIRFLGVNPSMWTYKDICNKVLELEAEGYEVHLCMVDYLLKVPTTGCDQGPAGTDIRNMYERIRNFMASRMITFITPHQLSTDAKMMVREGKGDFVKELVGKGYYAGCKQIDQVLDLEVFFHIVKLNNVSYLTVQRGKHRKDQVEKTPDEYLYCVFRFHDIGGIPDDYGKEDTTLLKVGGGPIGSGEEIPWFDNAI